MIFLEAGDNPVLPPPPLLPFRPGAEDLEADSAAITVLDVDTLLIVLLPFTETIVVSTSWVVLPVRLARDDEECFEPSEFNVDVPLVVCEGVAVDGLDIWTPFDEGEVSVKGVVVNVAVGMLAVGVEDGEDDADEAKLGDGEIMDDTAFGVVD